MEFYSDIKSYLGDMYQEELAICDDIYITRFEDIDDPVINEFERDRKYTTPHYRGFFEIVISIKDSSVVRIDENRLPNLDKTVSVVSPGQLFSVDVDDNVRYNSDQDEGVIISFNPSFLSPDMQVFEIKSEFPFFQKHYTPYYSISDSEIEEITDITNKILYESKLKGKHSIDIVRNYLKILLYTINRITSHRESLIVHNRFESITASFFQRITDSNGIFGKVEEYASTLNITPAYLSECVKKTTGKSAKQIIISYKILLAKSLLKMNSNSIADISDKMGYSEVTNFIKFFKNHTGTTPHQFRKGSVSIF